MEEVASRLHKSLFTCRFQSERQNDEDFNLADFGPSASPRAVNVSSTLGSLRRRWPRLALRSRQGRCFSLHDELAN